MAKYSHELKWALIFVAMTLVWMLGERLVGLHSTYIHLHPIYSMLILIPGIGIYAWAMYVKRERVFGGKMTWQQGFVCGLFISIFVALLSPLTQYLNSTFVSPDYFPNVIKYSVEKGLMKQEAAEEFFSLKSYILQSAVGSLVMGSVSSAIIAFFVKKA